MQVRLQLLFELSTLQVSNTCLYFVEQAWGPATEGAAVRPPNGSWVAAGDGLGELSGRGRGSHRYGSDRRCTLVSGPDNLVKEG